MAALAVVDAQQKEKRKKR